MLDFGTFADARVARDLVVEYTTSYPIVHRYFSGHDHVGSRESTEAGTSATGGELRSGS
jgi:hypothetical protein